MTPTPPNARTIDRYAVLRELGRGAMGVVYLAHDPKMERQVAIKTIKVLGEMDPAAATEARERFRREAKVAGGLNHPGILTVHDMGETADGLAFLVMEYVEGQTIDQILKSGQRFSESAVLTLLLQVADALAFAHARGIVHRDIKPANLIRMADGLVKIMDFGIAKIADSDLTQGGMTLGSPSYMSPEQILSSPLDGRSDLFSLGITAYQLLTGERPFAGETTQAITYRIINAEPVPPSRLNPQLNAGWDLILPRLLAKAPDQRYPNAGLLKRDLEALQEGRPLAAALPPGADSTLAMRSPASATLTGRSTGTSGRWSAASLPTPTASAARPASPRSLGRWLGAGAILIAAAAAIFLLMDFFGSDIRRARRLMEDGNPTLALGFLKEVLAEEAGNREALLLSAECYLALEDRPNALHTMETLLKADPDSRKHPDLARWMVSLYGEDEVGRQAKTLAEETFGVNAQAALQQAVRSDDEPIRRWKAAESVLALGIPLPLDDWLAAAGWMLEEAEEEYAVHFIQLLTELGIEKAEDGLRVADLVCKGEIKALYAPCLRQSQALMESPLLNADQKDLLAGRLLPGLLEPGRREKTLAVVRLGAGPKTEASLMSKAPNQDPAGRLAILDLLWELGRPPDEGFVAGLLRSAHEAGQIKEARDYLPYLITQPPSALYRFWSFVLLPPGTLAGKQWEALRDLTQADPKAAEAPEILKAAADLAYSKSLPPEARAWLARQPSVRQSLEKQMKGEDAAQRWQAAYALERLGVKVDRTPLYQQDLSSPNRTVRWIAANALKDAGKKVDFSPLYVADLKEDSCEIRKKAAEWLGRHGDRRALPALEAANEKVGFFDSLCLFGAIDDAIKAIQKRSAPKK